MVGLQANIHELSARVDQSLKGLEMAIDEVRSVIIPAHVGDVMANMTGMGEKFAARMDVIENQMRSLAGWIRSQGCTATAGYSWRLWRGTANAASLATGPL